MQNIRHLLIGLFVVLTCHLAAQSPVQLQLLSETEGVKEGESLWVAVEMTIEDGWHAYWSNPGDAGLPPRIDWDLPAGWSVGEVQWPYPHKLEDEMGTSYAYEGTVYLLAQLQPPKRLTQKSAVIAADVNWMVCGTSCMPGSDKVELTLPVRDTANLLNRDTQSAFLAARAHLPKPTQPVSAQLSEGTLTVSLPNDGSTISDAYFFPADGQLLPAALQQTVVNSDDGAQLVISGVTIDQAGLGALSGILVMQGSAGTTALSVGAISAPAAGSAGGMTFALALAMAFGGGLLLNLMPCVLPVIAFKIMSFIKLSGENRLTMAKHGFAFFAGALISFWVLAGLLLAFRAYGESLGWGFQLQSPLFVGILALVLTVFGMSLFGLFEMGTKLSSAAGAARTDAMGLVGSFGSGILATAVATPCTGPMLGATLGFAVTLSNSAAMAIFTMMGVGMAIPYLILSLFPKLVSLLPKPGPWMVAFKEGMGFLIIATVVWLAWVFGSLTSTNGLTMLLGALLIATMGCWVFGRWGSAISTKSVRRVSAVFTAAALALSVYVTYSASDMVEFSSGSQTIAEGEHGWLPYSEERLKELQAEGRPVFIDFTAKWCMICQANKVVLHSDEISRRFHQQGVVCMRADWTRSDPEITNALARFGRNGVPLYVLYDVSGKTTILPQALTSDLVLSALDELDSGQVVEAVAESDEIR